MTGVRALGRRPSPDSLVLAFEIEADLARVRVPAPLENPGIVHGLWEHTCCEAFVALDAAPREGFAYHELNLAPSGAWAAYGFRNYRVPSAVADESLAPRISVTRSADRLELEARVALDRLSPSYVGAPLRLALSAVVEEIDGTLSYWSLRHSAGRPDFHHADAFALRLEAPPGG